MDKRFVAIWFPYLKTDAYCRRQPGFIHIPFALTLPDHGRQVIAATNPIALQKGISPGMTVADARISCPLLTCIDDEVVQTRGILKGLAEWCIRFTPDLAIEHPDGLLLDVSGCAHLWGGENEYITEIYERLTAFGFHTRLAMAGTIGAAWALSRYGKNRCIADSSETMAALLSLPAAALRLETTTIERLQKLGLSHIRHFIQIPRPSLRRRFGTQMLQRIDQAFGYIEEIILPLQTPVPYQERLPCLEPLCSRTAIEIALQQLLQRLCSRLVKEGKGLRNCTFKGFRIDGKMESISISTGRATANEKHLFRLFGLKIDSLEPAGGIDFFLLEAGMTEDLAITQEKMWEQVSGLQSQSLMELLDRLSGKFGEGILHRYLPAEQHWPERSVKKAGSPDENPSTEWRMDKQRPVWLLKKPEPVQVTAPIPDYPPMNFRHKGKLHSIRKADGPERIEQEWWLQQGEHRDYYTVEDDSGYRYWIFRSGHYNPAKAGGWFLHGFFA